jgi:hypothetical protein
MTTGRMHWAAALATAAALSFALGAGTPSQSDEPPRAMNRLEPVEWDMHEFMEYACEEPYKRLKSSLAAAPANNAGWKGVKSDALLLAESGNLLQMRGPDERRAEWTKLSEAVRSSGAELYKAGKAKDFAAARPMWEALVVQCNACHKAFADGEHQLTP